ncbi:MAG: type II secretion protein F [Peptococcaceae bacterium]|nr:type II secretion protein F [Peptococcaceae bacterium]
MAKLIFLSSFMGFFLVYSLLMAVKPRKESIEEKVKRLAAEKEAQSNDKSKISWKKTLSSLSRFTPRRWTRQLDQELRNSGVPLTGGEYIILQAFLLILFSLIALTLSSINLAVIFLPLLSLILPRLYVIRSRNKRIRQFNNQLCDVLLTLANSLKAGFSLFQAMEMASQEMPDPISSEMRITLKEMTFGESTEGALIHLTERVKSRDLDLMITAILIQRQIGGNLAEILLGIHNTIQERLRIQGEVKSLTAQGRLSGNIIGALPFFIGIVITAVQPNYLSTLFHSNIGIIMVVCGLVLQVIGFIAIKRIVNIKY